MIGSMMICKRWFSALIAALALGQSAAQAQATYPLTSGGYLGASVATTPETYNAGYTFYSAAWPLMGDYPRDNQVQTGLYGTWMWPAKSIPNDHYTTIEGGLGWWSDRRFQTATPKFIMGGVAWGNTSWWVSNGPGSGSTRGNGKYGVAQLSPTLLFPPDGLNLRQGTNGQLLGSGYLALPLTEPKSTTAGAAIPTGNHCWTLFMNSGNFKGPAAFFTPYFWSQVMVANPQWAGQGFDSRWSEANKSINMETQETMRAVAYDTAASTFVRSMPVYYPVDENGYSLMMHRLCVYDQGALWDEVGQWLASTGSAPSGVINPGSTYVQTATGNNPVWTMKMGRTLLGGLGWNGIVSPFTPNTQEWGYQWKTDQLTVTPTATGSLVTLPEYYEGPLNANSASTWLPINKGDVPKSAATALASAKFSNPGLHNPVVAVDSDPAWTSPGPVSGPFRALLGDGSVVTYYWYRFAEQPTMLKADMTVAERNRLQTVVEKMHREWKNDRDYIAPPTTGTLADLDPGQLVTPPLGMEYGYVPIAWRQDWGGSTASPGSLNFTSVPATSAVGSSFSVTVQAVNTNGVPQNVTSATLVQLSVGTGYGTLSGTTVGTIPNGSSSVIITGATYSAAAPMNLKASATCLSPGTSASITFTNPSGNVNLYNTPATGITTHLAALNASLDCLGTNADIHVYWGPENGGINTTAWANSTNVGAWSDANSTTLSSAATGLLPDTTYYFTFRASNAAGVTWAPKVLSFKTLPLAPVITQQPVSSSYVVGTTASFTVTGLRATAYQWFKDAIPLANGGQVTGADTATLRLSGVAAGDAGSYSVMISNGSGQETSSAASLTVVATATLTWDANGTGPGVTDGGGQWASNSWRNGTSNANWANNHNAQIGSGGVGGTINLNEIEVNNLTLANFSGTYTLSSGTLTVMSNLTFNASGSAKLSSVIRGAGSLTKNGSGTLTVDGVTPNAYSGGTVINSGTLQWGTMVDGVSPSCDFACGTGPVTLNSGATIEFQRATPNNALILNGGTLISTNGWGATWAGPVTVNSNTTVRPNSQINIFGGVSGHGGFTKTGSATLTFSGHNTYSGTTDVQTGRITWMRASSVSPGHLVINTGAVADLHYVGSRAIENLSLGGVAMAVGTYGASTSPAANKNDNYFAGTGMVNVVGGNIAPVAETQNLSAEEDTALLITLAATDENEVPLSVSIVSQPTHGSLTVSGSEWTYMPDAHFIGADSFTYKANDGVLDSTPATVNINVTPHHYKWNTTVSGNWSDATQWLAARPANTGDDFYVLDFNEPGTYTATHDLDASFRLNQLNFGGSTLTLAGNKLTFVANGAALPKINQSSSAEVIIQNELNLGANTTFSGFGDGKVTATGLLSGNGGLTKNSPGTLQLYGLTPNTYSGGTIVNSGTLHLGALIGGSSPNIINPLGTEMVTLNTGGTIEFDRVSAANALTANGGTLTSANGWGATWSGPITLNAILNCHTPYQFICSNTISGTGGIIKTGLDRLILSGTSSYSGNTTVNSGTLQLNSSNPSNNGATLTIAASGATLNLNFVGTDTVNQLFIGTTLMPAGVYKAVGSAAAGTELAKLTGTGTLTVSTGSAEPTLPTLTDSSIVDDTSGGPITVNTLVTYAVTFSEDMDASTVTAADFGNAGSSVVTINTVTEIAPGVFTVTATPTSAGTLQLQVNAAAVLTDAVGIALVTTSAIADNTIITVTEINTAPVATAQSLTTPMNTPMEITLAGTDAENTTLTYIIVTRPTSGRLSGQEQNQTYSPDDNFFGADSFTFKVNDGVMDSAPTTVTINVTPTSFTWNTAVSGIWSDATNWTDAHPTGAGQTDAVLNFNAPGTYTATHDLDASFRLNQLNFGGSTLTLAGNNLTLTANGTTLPQVNQTSANAVTVSTNLSMAANTTIAGSGLGALTLSGIISGGATLTKTTPGNLTLSGVNTYSGGTTINNGSLTLANKNGLGTGALTLAAGTTFQQSTFEANSSEGALPNAFVLSGSGNVIMNLPFNGAKDVWLSQPISGTGGLTIQGGGRSLTLTANNTFSGGVKLTNADNRIQIAHLNALGTGTFRTERTTAGSDGKLTSLANLSTAPGVPNAFDIAAGACLNLFINGSNHLLLAGPITSAVGTGHLHKSGTATLTLTGTNTYSGTTTVAAGTLACSSATAMGHGPLVITNGKLNLIFTGTRQVASLSLAGSAQPNGTYGATTSPATNKNDTYFSGTGTVTVGPVATTTMVASNRNPATAGDAVTLTATVTGSTPTGEVAFYAGAALLGSNALNGSFQASLTTSSLAIGNHSVTAVYAGNSINAASTSTAMNQGIDGPPYESWASDPLQGLTASVNNGPLDDPDHDGVANLMEFALGGAPMVSSHEILPILTKRAATWLFTYDRSVTARATTTQVVEYGSNLTGWTPVSIPQTSEGIVEITPGSLGDHVQVIIPNQGSQTFVRLKVSQK